MSAATIDRSWQLCDQAFGKGQEACSERVRKLLPSKHFPLGMMSDRFMEVYGRAQRTRRALSPEAGFTAVASAGPVQAALPVRGRR